MFGTLDVLYTKANQGPARYTHAVVAVNDSEYNSFYIESNLGTPKFLVNSWLSSTQGSS